MARRIAHEIKNPLTPIQLSAERLKRKYSREIETDPDVFAQCTDTIIRQVGDIGRMVDEFSSFARMPAPVMRPENVQELLQQAVFLQRVANPQIAFDITAPAEPLYIECDGRLVSQALTNVLKNAVEAIDAREAEGDDTAGPDRRSRSACEGGSRPALSVADNGIGLPPEHASSPDRALCDDARKGHGAWPRDRAKDCRGPWRRDRAGDPWGRYAGRRDSPDLSRCGSAVRVTTEVEAEDEQERIADRA